MAAALGIASALQGFLLGPSSPRRCHVRGHGLGAAVGATATGATVLRWRVALDAGATVEVEDAAVSWHVPGAPGLCA